MLAQDPDAHSWLYFRARDGSETYLDACLLPFGFAEAFDISQVQLQVLEKTAISAGGSTIREGAGLLGNKRWQADMGPVVDEQQRRGIAAFMEEQHRVSAMTLWRGIEQQTREQNKEHKGALAVAVMGADFVQAMALPECRVVEVRELISVGKGHKSKKQKALAFMEKRGLDLAMTNTLLASLKAELSMALSSRAVDSYRRTPLKKLIAPNFSALGLRFESKA